MLPTLLKIYIAEALKKWNNQVRGMGVEIENSDCLQFVDDQLVFSIDKDDVKYMVRKFIEDYNKLGLTLSIKRI